MPRQTITFTDPNAEWLKAQVGSKEYTSITDAVNDLVRRARREEGAHLEKIRALLIEGEESITKHGYSDKTPEEILATAKGRAQELGIL